MERFPKMINFNFNLYFELTHKPTNKWINTERIPDHVYKFGFLDQLEKKSIYIQLKD